MSNILLRKISTAGEKELFTKEVQAAFQTAYETENVDASDLILPTEDVASSFSSPGAQAFFAEIDGERVGGVIVVVNPESQANSLDLLYVKVGKQNLGAGLKIWREIEKRFPKTKVWETHTPYFDKRNIHFYVNRYGFKIVEFYTPNHSDPHQQGDRIGGIPPEQNYFFRFEKEMEER